MAAKHLVICIARHRQSSTIDLLTGKGYQTTKEVPRRRIIGTFHETTHHLHQVELLLSSIWAATFVHGYKLINIHQQPTTLETASQKQHSQHMPS